MQPFIHWLETSFSPRMAKVNNNVWVVSIKDSIMQVLPFILVGSVFAMLAILNDYFPSLPSFWTPYGWTMGMLSLLVSFLIPFNLMEKRNFRKQRLIAGGSGTILLLLIITPQVVKDGEPGFGHAALGAGGMFVAILAGVVSGLIMSLFGGFSLFKEESVIPEFVRAWFDAMIPVGLVVTLGWVVVDLLGLDVYNAVLAVFRPLAGIIESPWGFPLMCLTYCFLYSMGISSWVLTPVTTPVLLAAIQANMAGTAENLVTSTTLFSTYLWFGGIGNTMALVLMMAASKSTRLKALGRACLPPAIVNINEPVVFGAIAWNPVLMVPMWLQGLIPPILVWLLTKTIRFAPIPMNQFELWYTPYPLATWITTRSLSAIVLMLLVFAVSAVIWYPFFKVYEHQSLLKEARDSAGSEAGRTGGPDGRSKARVAGRTGGRAGASASTAPTTVRRGSRRLTVVVGRPQNTGADEAGENRSDGDDVGAGGSRSADGAGADEPGASPAKSGGGVRRGTRKLVVTSAEPASQASEGPGMNDTLVEASTQILIHSGDARKETYRALEAMEAGDLARARAHLDAADEHIRQAHAEHTGIIQLEAGGRTLPYAALFSHAQDTLMTTYSELRLARRLLPVFRTLDDRIRALEAKNHD